MTFKNNTSSIPPAPGNQNFSNHLKKSIRKNLLLGWYARKQKKNSKAAQKKMEVNICRTMFYGSTT
ncbi:hypothetical protein SOVF_164870 [Spinacia oleracea]|nr:hypothetical protein SOVF_164870 [Spinacia oleracea]